MRGRTGEGGDWVGPPRRVGVADEGEEHPGHLLGAVHLVEILRGEWGVGGFKQIQSLKGRAPIEVDFCDSRAVVAEDGILLAGSSGTKSTRPPNFCTPYACCFALPLPTPPLTHTRVRTLNHVSATTSSPPPSPHTPSMAIKGPHFGSNVFRTQTVIQMAGGFQSRSFRAK